MNIIGNLVGFFLPAYEDFCFFYAFGIRIRSHLCQLDDPMTLFFPANIVVIQTLQVIGEPLIHNCQKSEECQFSSALRTDKAETDIIFSQFIQPRDSNQHIYLHHFSNILVVICSQEMVKRRLDSFFSIP